MNTKKNLLPFTLLALLLVVLGVACKKDAETLPNNLLGTKGKLRFYLKIHNSDTADLDLHLETPNGNLITYSSIEQDGGKYEYDCRCQSCPNGGWENIYWAGENNEPPKGTYKYKVKFYNYCKQEGGESDFTVYCIYDGKLKQTFNGRLAFGNESGTYTFVLD